MRSMPCYSSLGLTLRLPADNEAMKFHFPMCLRRLMDDDLAATRRLAHLMLETCDRLTRVVKKAMSPEIFRDFELKN